MMDIAVATTAISTTYEGIKTCKALFQGILDKKIDDEVGKRAEEIISKLGNAQDTLFSMRDTLFKLQEENKKLCEQIEQSNKWETRRGEYTLVETDGGAIVYQYQGDPKHYACPSCIENNKAIQILQDNRTGSGKYRCVSCSAEYPIKPRERQTTTPQGSCFA